MHWNCLFIEYSHLKSVIYIFLNYHSVSIALWNIQSSSTNIEKLTRLVEHKEHLTHTVCVYTHTQTPHAVAAGWQARLPNNSIKQQRVGKRKRRNRGERERERKRKACSLSAARPPLQGKKGRNTSEIKKRSEEKREGVKRESSVMC